MIELWPNELPGIRGDEKATDPEDFRPHLQGPFLPADHDGSQPLPAAIVFPGGGYRSRARHEGEEIAEALSEQGIAAFVLHYRVRPWRYPAALMDAQRAIRLLRARASDYAIDPDNIGVVGFSAGGHAAGTLALRSDDEVYQAIDDLAEDSNLSAQPNWAALGYAVISAVDHCHMGSWLNALGAGADWQDRAEISLERFVRRDAPPFFLWSTSNDNAVPVQNTYNLAGALADAGIQHEVHVYRDGSHGLGLAEGHNALWFPAMIEWLKDMGNIS